MNIPENVSLPFFAYGLFKPGELSYPRIKDLVTEYDKVEASGYLKERDGTPLFIKSDHSKIRGYVLNFKPSKEIEAYNRIMEIEPKNLYKWDIIKIRDIKANVLAGRRIDRGSSDLENVYEWKGMEDPYFSVAIDEIESILNENSNFLWDYKVLFRLQMAYMLLWSSIERYVSLKYNLNKNPNKNILNLAIDPIFAISLKKYVKDRKTVYSAADPRRPFILDPLDPEKSIRYFYQIRSNTVHRGKIAHQDFNTISFALRTLLYIFKDVLDNSWNY